jgi:hypothetical protein
MLFDKAGPHNTRAALQAAFELARERRIAHLVVASTTGATGLAAAEMGKQYGVSVIVVTHNTGFKEPGRQELEAENRRRIEEAGARIHTGTHTLRGLGSAIRKKTGGSEEELVANSLRIFGQGLKVCVEMAAMVSDAGLVPAGEIICVAGTGNGADAAALIRPAPSNQFFDIRVREVICKPRDF